MIARISLKFFATPHYFKIFLKGFNTAEEISNVHERGPIL